MDLIQHLQISTPLVWLQTEDLHEVEDVCIHNSDKDIYIFNPLKGLSIYDRKVGEFRTVLAEVKPNEFDVVGSIPPAVFHLIKKTSTDPALLLMYNPAPSAEALQEILIFLQRDYLAAMKTNDASKIPLQFVFVSTTNSVPPEISSFCTQATLNPPSEEECTNIIGSYAEMSPTLSDSFDKKKMIKCVRSTIGLSRHKLREALNLSVSSTGAIDESYLEEYRKTLIKENGFLEIIRPTQGLESIGGLDNLKDMIRAAARAWENPEEVELYGEPIRRILMVGVPGTGKSAICKATAYSLGLDLVKFGVSQMMNKYIGQSEANMRAAFRQINAMAPVAAWIDELGRDFSGSHTSNDGGTTDRVQGELLTGLQEMNKKVFLLAAANYIDGLPPEMLRAGRFDQIIFVGFPTARERAQILKIHLGKDWEEFDIVKLANSTSMFTGSELESIIKKTRSNVGYSERRKFNTEDLLAGFKAEKNRLWLRKRGEMVNMYRRALEQFEWASSEQKEEAKVIIKSGASNKGAVAAQGSW